MWSARPSGSQARTKTSSPPLARHALGSSSRVSRASPVGAPSASEPKDRGGGDELHCGACHARERALVPIARLSSGAVRTVVMTVSSSVSRRQAEDASGPLLAHLAEDAGAEIVAMEVVPDDFALIEDRLHHYVDAGVSFVFTTGGTGLTPDDITPEATWAVIAREAPGIAEAMRAESARHTPMGILSRGVAGVAGQTLIVNFPGNPKAIEQLFPVLAPVLGHAAATLSSEGGSRASH
jgi:molybdopterin adenylyltransferase